MAVPLDGIRAIHNAFRKDIAALDASAYAAALGQGDLDHVLDRHIFLNEILVWHAEGEENFVFTELERVAPLVAEAYIQDHRGLDQLSEMLHKAVTESDPIATSRSTAALKFHLDIHLNKEDTHLYQIFNDRISLQDQGAIMSKMAQKIPQNRFPEVVGWLYPLLGHDDRENMTRLWKLALPEPAFAGAVQLIRSAIGNDWEELVRRIPELK